MQPHHMTNEELIRVGQTSESPLVQEIVRRFADILDQEYPHSTKVQVHEGKQYALFE
jgi:GTPase Era involved in 16S rRNA processing